MGKYKVLKDVDNQVVGVKLYKDEVLEGVPNVNLSGFVTITKNGKTISTADKFEVQKVDDNTPISIAPASQVAVANSSENTLVIASSVGALAGLGFAFYRKSSVGGYIGYFILGSIVGSLIAHVIKPKTSTENTSPKNASKTEQSGNKKKLLDVLKASGYSDGLKAGAIDKLSEGAITAGFVMLDSAIKYKNNKAKSIAENDTRIKNDYGVDINSSQFSKDIAEFWEQVA